MMPLTAYLFAVLPGLGHAGNNNSADLLQVSTGPVGNALTIDQSEAHNSLVAGDPVGFQPGNPLLPASQFGQDNAASATLSGDGTRFLLEQGQSGLPVVGNEAVAIIAGAAGLGGIQQFGNDNSATLQVNSTSALFPAEGLIVQQGDRNAASLTVEGVNVSGTIRQIGSDNVNGLLVNGQDTSVVYTQNGNGLVNPVGGSGVSVFTNAGSISITQTALGTP